MRNQVLGQLQHLQLEQISEGVGIDLRQRVIGQIEFSQIGHVNKVTGIYALDVVLGQVPENDGQLGGISGEENVVLTVM